MNSKEKRQFNKIPHKCHWPGCQKDVDPKNWGCQRHWMLVPADKRQKLIANYKTDQEIYKNPSDEYIRVLLDIDAWCKEQNMRLGRVV